MPFPERAAGMLHLPFTVFIQALECPQVLWSHHFRNPWDVQESEQQDTSVSGRLLPTLGFFYHANATLQLVLGSLLPTH